MRFKNFGLVIAAMFLLAACESTSVEEGASTGTGAQSGGTSTTSSSASGSGAGSMARASAIREGSPQDFVINVGDRVYYDLDKSNIRADQRAQLEKQAAWLKKFPAVHASIYNHFNLERHLNRRDIFKQDRAAALAEWRQLAA